MHAKKKNRFLLRFDISCHVNISYPIRDINDLNTLNQMVLMMYTEDVEGRYVVDTATGEMMSKRYFVDNYDKLIADDLKWLKGV